MREIYPCLFPQKLEAYVWKVTPGATCMPALAIPSEAGPGMCQGSMNACPVPDPGSGGISCTKADCMQWHLGSSQVF
eukprot:1143148-Pelagomonas_calceolata.AAC.6